MGCKLTNDVDGDKVADIGDEITCGGTESFYVYSSDSTDIKMLAKYNLYVGGEYDASTSTYTAYGDDATGLQDVNMKGFNSLAIRKGTTIFSNDDVKGTNYSDYEGSLVQKYVREYAAKLSEKGVKASEVTLITKEEIDILANKTLDVEYINSWAPKWLYSSSYWTRSAYSENAIWFVSNSGSFSYTNYNNNSLFGVRPVVVISSYDIKESIPKLACRATECIDNDKSKDISIGDLITYDTESFYVYSNDSTNIKMLAQYNLEVGNNKNSLYPVTTEKNLQSEKTLETNYGVVAFSSTSEKGTSYTDYEGSIVQNYVNIYATKLAEKGINAKEVTLLSLEELKLLGCSSDEFTCENAPEFVYSMQYWTKTKYNDTNIWCVRNNKELSYISYKSGNVSNTSTFGVRPTVYISVDEI